MKKGLKVIFFGTPDLVIPVLETLCRNFNLVGVVTAPDRPVGRKQVLTPSAVAQRARQDGLNIKNIFKPERLDDQLIRQLTKLSPDLIIVAAYGKIIPQTILDIPRLGALNIHPSLLPKYRGASPIQAAILAGDSSSGVTIIKMDVQMDHGSILAQEEIKLSEEDTFDNLSNKLFQQAANLLIKILPDYIGRKIQPMGQDHQQATYCKLIKKEDGYFEFNNPPSPQQLERMIRAYYPWPTAWTIWKDKVVKFLPKGVVHPQQIGVQLEGKKPVPLKDFLNGRPDLPITF